MFDAVRLSYTRRSRKKKHKFFIIPISYFQPQKTVETVSLQAGNTKVETEENITPEHTYSSLSLKSIENKRKLESSIHPIGVNEENRPADSFTEEQLLELWAECEQNYFNTGRMLMGANMQIAHKKIKGNVLQLEFPSKGTKESFEENMYDLINFLRRRLNNYNFQIETLINETLPEKKIVLTSQEKLSYLKDKYLALDELVKAFGLSLKD